MSKSLEIQLRADVANALKAVQKVDKGLHGLGKEPAGPSQGLRKTDAMLNKLKGTIGGVRGKLNTLGKFGLVALGAGLTAGAIAGGASIVKLGVQMEQTRVRFQTMLGDAEKGNKVLGQLNEFANVTPFTNDQVVTAGKTLLAYGLEAEKLQGTLKIVGDVAAGSGKDFTELSGIVGKVMSKGKADTEALNQMAEAGIPIVKTLAKAYGVGAADIYKMAEKGKLTGDVINAAFQQMTAEGGIFANMMEKQSQTAGGMWSTVIGKLQFFASILGEKLTPLIKVGLGYLVKMADSLLVMTSDGSLIRWLADAGKTGVTVFSGILKTLNYLYEGGKAVFQMLAEYGIEQFSLISGAAKLAVYGIVEGFYGMVNGILKAYNWVMGKFGKGGVELMQKPGWIDDLGTSGKNDMSVAGGLMKRRFTGGAFMEAADRAESKNSVLDKGVEKIHKLLDGFVKGSETGKSKKGDIANIPFPAIAAAAEKAAKAKKVKTTSAKIASDRTSVDRLTKIGLYNFGPQVKSVDVQRNGLLKQILNKLDTRVEYRLA